MVGCFKPTYSKMWNDWSEDTQNNILHDSHEQGYFDKNFLSDLGIHRINLPETSKLSW